MESPPSWQTQGVEGTSKVAPGARTSFGELGVPAPHLPYWRHPYDVTSVPRRSGFAAVNTPIRAWQSNRWTQCALHAGLIQRRCCWHFSSDGGLLTVQCSNFELSGLLFINSN
jgi:hypothetical protein